MNELIQKLRQRAIDYRLGGPSSEHTALLLDEAAAALEAVKATAPAQTVLVPIELAEAASELAQYASYAEIVGAISHNRAPIRKWSDEVFRLYRLYDDAKWKADEAAIAPSTALEANDGASLLDKYLDGPLTSIDRLKLFESDPEQWPLDRDDAENILTALEANQQVIETLRAQNEWLKDRLADLQLAPNSHQNIEEWLVDCGMPAAVNQASIASADSFDDTIAAWLADVRALQRIIATKTEAIETLRAALEAMVQAVCGDTGFANAVRTDIGKAYPWPALGVAEALARAALSDQKGE